jgi:hypothetical protein
MVKISNRFWKIFITVLASIPIIYVLIRYLLPLGFFLISFGIFSFTQHKRVENSNYPEILSACRNMICNIDSIKPLARKDLDWRPKYYIRFEDNNNDKHIPEAIRKIKPIYFIIDSSQVLLVFLGGFDHLALRAFPEGVKGYGTKELIPGLWLVEESK